MSTKGEKRVAIVTDSTSDLPPSLAAKYGICVVPQILIMGDRTWRDGVDIDPPTFYELLQSSPTFPSTSQPSAAQFVEVFTTLAEEAEGVLAVLISDELSGTLNSARAAAESLPEIPIEIVDSRAASMQLGLIVLAAARAVAGGAGLTEAAELAREMVPRAQVYFVVDTLEYLHRGGRIGAASRLVGSALNLKPILQVQDGLVTPVTRVRSRRKALDTTMGLLAEQIPVDSRVHMSVLHVAAPDEAAQLQSQLEGCFQPVEMVETECGPVIGAHTGPGTVGVAFYVE
jgi:DegV family protein with EDD domain